MKIAVFHNFMDNIGGAEMVGLTLARELNADFYSTNIDENKIKKMGFNDITLKSIGKIPVNAPYRQQAALRKFSKLDLKNNYDFYIIDGDWAVSGAVNNKPNLWYVHSPIREIWDLYEFTRQNIVPYHLRWCFDLWMHYNRYLNKKYVRHVDKLVCNSKNTRNRVKKFLEKDAGVIHPPTETSNYSYKEPGNYWLSVNRLIGHKRIALQIDAFTKLPHEKLVIVGSYEQSERFREHAAYIKKIKPRKLPKNSPIILWITELFPENSLEQNLQLCEYLKTTNKDKKDVENLFLGKQLVSQKDTEDTSWAHFYAIPNSQKLLEIISENPSFLQQHSARKQKLHNHIQRIIKKTPLIQAKDLKELNIPPGKLMGTLLKKAERISINKNIENKEEILKYLH